MLVPPTITELATFTGRPGNSFDQYVVEALAQATLLFQLATDLDTYPTDPAMTKLAKNGIMDMADKIYLSQPYREASASPYQSETIGSYSYSKATNAVKKGDATGVLWFDMAVNKLKASGSGIMSSGSISGMEFDGLEVDASGRYRISGAPAARDSYILNWELDTRYPYGNNQ